MGDDRPNVYIDPDGTVVYRASSVGMCVRALVAVGVGNYEEALGKDRADMLIRTAAEGDLHEEAVRSKLAREGWTVHSTQNVVDIPVINGVVIRGHTDGVLSLKNDPHHLLEVKSMSNRRFDRWVKQGFDGFLKYAYQISAYMQAFEEMDVLYVVKRREDGFEDRRIIKAGESPIPFKEIKRKILTAESHRRSKGAGFPACDVPSSEQWWCPFFYLHEEVMDEEAEELTDEMIAVLADLIPKRAELSELEKEGVTAEKERKSLDKEILNLMGKGRDKVIVEVDGVDWQITRVSGGGVSLDQGMLRSDLGEEIMKYERPYRFEYPKLTPKKKQIKKQIKKGTK